jgi:hypothetical protein
LIANSSSSTALQRPSRMHQSVVIQADKAHGQFVQPHAAFTS